MAVEGLVIQGEKGIDFLTRSLKSTLPVVRENMAKALGLTKNTDAVAPLLGCLQDPVASVRKSAVEALGRLRDKSAIDGIVAALKDNVPEVQKQASDALIDFGLLSTEPLLQALTHERNKFVLRSVILTLGEIRDPRSIPALTKQIRNPYFLLRAAAVDALTRFGPRIIPELLPHLVPNQTPVDGLLGDAADFDRPPVQLRAIRALGALEEHRATKALKKAIQDGKPEVAQAAREAMVQIGTGAWGRACAILALKEVADASITSRFMRALKDDALNVRLEAVRALGKIGGKKAVGPLSTIIRKSRFDCLRAEAMHELRDAGVGSPRAIDAAIFALKDCDWNVRLHAAGFLGNYLDDKSIRPLVPLLADSHWCVRQVAETALHNFGKRASGPLAEMLEHKSADVQLTAVHLLAEAGGAEAVLHVEKALKRRGGKKFVIEALEAALKKMK
jgi:HEAT repeat protein